MPLQKRGIPGVARRRRTARTCALLALACAAGTTGPAHAALNINFNFGTFDTAGPAASLFGGGSPQTVIEAAGAYWENAFAASTRNVSTTLNIVWGPRDGAALATGGPSWSNNPPNYSLVGGTITFDSDGSSVFYVDPNPYNNSEYSTFTAPTQNLGGGAAMIVGRNYTVGNSSAVTNNFDLLSIAVHEIGHTLGIIDSYPRYDNARLADSDGADLDLTTPRQFPGAQIPVANSHLNISTANLSPSIASNSRKLLSEADILLVGETEAFDNINLNPAIAADPQVVYTYNPTNATTDQWSTGANWTGGAPVSGLATRLTFVANNATVLPSGLSNVNTDNVAGTNVGGRFQLNVLDLQGTGPVSGSAAININSGGSATGGLSLTGLSPTVNLNANGNTLTYQVNAALSAGADTLVTGDGTAAFRFAGGIAAPTITLTKTGTSNLSFGANTSLKNLALGYHATGGTITGLPGASLTIGTGAAADYLRVGVRETSAVNSAGTLDFSLASGLTANVGVVRVGYNAGGNETVAGTLKLGGATAITAVTEVAIGRSTSSSNTTATVTTANGSLTTIKTPTLYVAGGKANATFTIGSAASLNVAGVTPGQRAALGVGAYQANTVGTGNWTGTMDLSAGTFNATLSSLTIGLLDATGAASQTGALTLGTSPNNHLDIAGASSTSAGVVTMGRWVSSTIGTTGAAGTLTIGNLDSTSEINSTNNSTAILLATGNSKTAGTLNLNGGTLKITTTGVGIGGGAGTSNVRFDGVTLVAGASSSTWIQGLTTADLGPGGATFNTNGFDVTIAQSLGRLVGAPAGALTKQGAGTLTLSGSNTYTGATNVNAGTLAFTRDVTTATTSGVTVAAGARAVLANTPATPPDGTVIDVPVTLAGSIGNWQSTLDLTDNDMIVRHAAGQGAATLARVNDQVRSALNLPSGFWDGPGITSSAAAADPAFNKALGVISNDLAVSTNGQFTGAFVSSFANRGVDENAVLVKFTWFGDADLSGSVDGTDYGLIDAGFLSNGALTGWFNGDFDYSGTIDGTDYGLIDGAFLTQDGTTLGTSAADAVLAQREAQFGDAYVSALVAAVESGSPAVVPEPGSLGVLALAGAGLLARRRRRN
jgi:autotransporter-associated beta strand protein